MRPFEEIVVEQGPMVLRVCRAVAGPTDAEDAWSETFLAAMRAYPGLDPGANVQAWLVTIAHRKAVDAVRAAARRPVAMGEVPDRPDPAAGRAHGDVWHAVAALPARQREAIAYHHLAGLSYAEVAAVTGGTAAAARRAASDGMRGLRRALTEGGERRRPEGNHG